MSVISAMPPMPATATRKRVPRFLGSASFRKFTLAEYHKMIEIGVLIDGEPYELLEGYLLLKMPRSPEHDFTISAISDQLYQFVPRTFSIRGQCAATIQESEPEPDLVIARGNVATYRHRHPGPTDTALVIEASASSLDRDRTDKAFIYAHASIPIYWVVNVIDRVIEVYTLPSGPSETAAYAHREDYPVGTAVPVVLDGVTVGTIPVADVMG